MLYLFETNFFLSSDQFKVDQTWTLFLVSVWLHLFLINVIYLIGHAYHVIYAHLFYIFNVIIYVI